MSLKFSNRRGILYRVRDSCKKCSAPFDNKNTRHVVKKTPSGRKIKTRECRNCRKRHDANYRERNRQYRRDTIYGSLAKENV